MINIKSNLLSPDAFYDLKMCQNAFAAGALPRPRSGSLYQTPKPPIAGFKGARFAAKMGEKGKGRERTGGMGKGGKGREWDVSG